MQLDFDILERVLVRNFFVTSILSENSLAVEN